MKKTKTRRAVDRAAAACLKAHEALSAMQKILPDDMQRIGDRHQRWINELGEYGDYLSAVTWPDTME